METSTKVMELVPEQLDRAVVINVINPCTCSTTECPSCSDYAVGLHNWLIATGLKYVIFDLQDEKAVCPVFLEEVLQLWKRMRFPFLFSGVMPKPKATLQSYSYDKRFPLYTTPNEAVEDLRSRFPASMNGQTSGITFGQPMPMTRTRMGMRGVDGEVVDEENSQDVED